MRTRFYEFQAPSLFSWLMERRTAARRCVGQLVIARPGALWQVPARGRGGRRRAASRVKANARWAGQT